MNWDAIGATGEWAGAIAVVITLAYLARQISQQNKIAKHTAWQSIFDGFNQELSLLGKSKEDSALWVLGLTNPEELNDAELAQFSNMFRFYYNNMLKAYQANKLGFLGDSEWQDLARTFAGAISTPGGKLFLEGNEGLFQDFLDAILTTEAYTIDFGMGRNSEAGAN
jgi:hypothetical protein